jgi:cytochrome P450
VRWEEELRGWLVTGYADVAAALAEPRVSRGRGPREGDLLTRRVTRMMPFTDPPDHTRLRALANRAFTPKRVETRRPWIAAVVDEQLAEVAEVKALACELLKTQGLPLSHLVERKGEAMLTGARVVCRLSP